MAESVRIPRGMFTKLTESVLDLFVNKIKLDACESMSDLYKQIMEWHLQRGYLYPEQWLDRHHEIIVNEIIEFAVSNTFQFNPAQLRRECRQILSEVKAMNGSQNAKAAFNKTVIKGRYSGGFSNFEFVWPSTIDGVLVDAVERGLSDFGTQTDKFCSQVWGRLSGLCQQIDTQTFGLQNLINLGIKRRRVSAGVYIEHIVDDVSYIWANPIECQLFLHNPNSVDGADWKLKKIEVLWRFSGAEMLKTTFSCLVPGELSVTCPAEVEFIVEKGYCIRPWAKVLSLGMNYIYGIYDTSKTQTYTSNQFSLKLVGSQDTFWKVKSREKMVINIKEEVANEYLEIEKQLYELKHFLNNDEGISALRDCREQEMDQMQYNFDIDTSGLESMANLLNQTNAESEAIINRMREGDDNCFLAKLSSTTEGTVLVQTYMATIRQNRFLEFELIEANAMTGQQVTNLIKKRYEIFSKNGTFKDLSSADLNNLSGFVFEDILNARIREAAAKKGLALQFFEGDGAGILPTNQKTPDYVDAAFINPKTGEYTGVQYKFTDKSWKLEAMVKSHKDKYGETIFEGVENLNADKIQMVGPRDVKADGAVGQVEIDGVLVVDTPTTQEVFDFIEHNWQDCFSGSFLAETNRLQQQIKNLNKKIDTLQKDIANKSRAIKKLEGNTNERAMSNRKERQKQFEKLTEELNSIKNIAAEAEEALKAHSNTKEVVTGPKVKFKEVAKDIGKAALVAAVVETCITLVTSLSEEITKWRRGEQSGSDAAWNVAKQTGIAFLRGGAVGGVVAGLQQGAMAMTRYENVLVKTFGNFATKALGPVLIVSTFGYQAYSLLKQHSSGSITTGELQRQLIRTASITGFSTGGAIFASAVCATGWGAILLGSAICIGAVLGDHFGGDDFLQWIGIKDDPEEQKLMMERYCKKLEEKVLRHAYSLFDLEEHCSDEELKQAYRHSVLKYHPDRGGNQAIFQAVFSAYTIIKTHRANIN